MIFLACALVSFFAAGDGREIFGLITDAQSAVLCVICLWAAGETR